MGIHFPTKLVGEDPTTDLTRTNFKLYNTEALEGSLANLDKLMAACGQVSPAWGTVEDQPKELAYLYDDTDDLILSIIPADLVDFDNLPMGDGETSLTALTDDHFDDLLMEDEETSLAVVTDDPEVTQGRRHGSGRDSQRCYRYPFPA